MLISRCLKFLITSVKILLKSFKLIYSYYRPQTKLRKGNVFTPVCQSFCSQGGVCLSACWDTHPLGRYPQGPQADTSWVDTPWQTLQPGETPPQQTSPCPVHAWIDMATAADGSILLECILVVSDVFLYINLGNKKMSHILFTLL